MVKHLLRSGHSDRCLITTGASYSEQGLIGRTEQVSLREKGVVEVWILKATACKGDLLVFAVRIRPVEYALA